MFEALARLECGSGSKFNLHLGLVDDWEPTLQEDLGRRAAIARLRNHLLDKFLEPEQCALFLPSAARLHHDPRCIRQRCTDISPLRLRTVSTCCG